MSDHASQIRRLPLTVLRFSEKEGQYTAEPAPAEPPARPSAGLVAELSAVPDLDVAAGLQYVQNDETFYRLILVRFTERHAEDSDAMLNALACGDFKAMAHLAHILKGIASTLGAWEIQRLAAPVEAMAGQLADGCPDHQARMIHSDLEILTGELARQLDVLVKSLRVVHGL